MREKNFSQRIGKTPFRETLQIESIDSRLENALWNNFYKDFISKLQIEEFNKSLQQIWEEYLGRRADEIPVYGNNAINDTAIYNAIKEKFFESEWYEKYDFIEFIAKLIQEERIHTEYIEKCNQILEKESSGYRIIKNQVTPITSEVEVQAIEDVLTDFGIPKVVRGHIDKALGFLTDRKNPDYENSIKESVCAIESYFKTIAGGSKEKFSDAVNEVCDKFKIHGALTKAITSLFGYASQIPGGRHGGNNNAPTKMEDAKMEDAKFIIVICSGLLNYFTMKVNLKPTESIPPIND